MASQYSSSRADFRKANPGVNTTQRSWDNYEGDRPVKSRQGTDFYGQSERWGPTPLSQAINQLADDEDEKQDTVPTNPQQRARRKSSMSGYDQMRILNSAPLTGTGGALA
jgi:hypothetical protein